MSLSDLSVKVIGIVFEIGIQSKKDAGSLRQGMTLKNILGDIEGGKTIKLLRTLADTQSSYAMLKFTRTTQHQISTWVTQKTGQQGYTGWLL